MEQEKSSQSQQQKQPGLFGLLKFYWPLIVGLIVFALASNGLNLAMPKIVASGIDAYIGGRFVMAPIVWEFLSVSVLMFVFVFLQSIVQTYASERVARDLRTKLSAKISRQSYLFVQNTNPAKLLTNLTSDIDSVKLFVAQAIVSIISSVVLIVGASVLLLMINWRLALAVLTIIPIIGATFFLVLAKVRVLFLKSRQVIDWLNKVINESILGAALIRVLNSQQPEFAKFVDANTSARNLGLQILKLFSSMIPIITFVSSAATLVVLALGGHFVIAGTMTLGDFAAFNSYITILIFPILVIGFMSNVIAQATASYGRVVEVLDAVETSEQGTEKYEIRGDIAFKNVTLNYGEKPALKNVSFTIPAGSKTAIIGPTAAGKTQLLYLLTALIKPNSGTVEYDGKNIEWYDSETLHRQIGFVFQDSIVFNLSLRENIAFSDTVTDESLAKAIATAELKDFIDGLPEHLSTVVSERGASLSGGQKQRIMLARALALDPKVLLLDDFTARVDGQTEQKILSNVAANYPGITLVSVTQKISSIEQYDQIILLMEGEILASGIHEQLLKTSPEYAQIYESQKSTSHYESTTWLMGKLRSSWSLAAPLLL